MDSLPGIQKALFSQIKQHLPANFSFVHEIAELLEISYDSAYRRIRGEKDLSLDEVIRICRRFNISIDTLSGVRTNQVVFSNFTIEPEKFNMKDWAAMILKDIRQIHQAGQKEILYAAKDPPVFHYFQFPEIAAFKFFFWEKTLFQFPELEDSRLRFDELDSETVDLGRNILKNAITIPTTEIWNEDTFNILIRQMEYYWIAGFFASKDDILNLLDKMEKWVQHIEKQAHFGFKYNYGDPPEGLENSFKFYENEVVLNDNTIHVRMDNQTRVYLTYNVVGLLITQDPAFCNTIESYIRGLTKKSNLISVSGSKERNRFFNRMLDKINQFRNKLDLD